MPSSTTRRCGGITVRSLGQESGAVVTRDQAAAAVLAAFQAAREAGKPSVDCYRAGVRAWKELYPDQAPEYAAKQAVAIILAANSELKIYDKLE
jgi:predicted Zn-dependent protease